MVIGLWALIFRFSVIRKQALVHLLGIKQTQKLTRMANLSHADFLLTLFTILPKYLDKGVRRELTN